MAFLPDVDVFATKDAAATALADAIAQALREAIAKDGRATLALSGGESPRPAYRALADQPGIAWGKVHVYFVDERAVPPDSERSNYRWAKETLFAHAGIPEAQIHRMVAESPAIDASRERYEALLREVVRPGKDGFPSFDVGVFGVGDDGHTASLFPGRADVLVRDRVVIAIPLRKEAKTEPRLTITAPVIEATKTRLVLATGAGKKAALARLFAEVGSLEETPSRVLRCEGTRFLLDEGARP